MPYAGRLQIPSARMGRQIRSSLIMSYSVNEKIWDKKNSESTPETVKFIMHKR